MKCEIKLGYDVVLRGIIPESIEIPLSEFQQYRETELQLAADMLCSNTDGLGGCRCRPVRLCGRMYEIVSKWAKKFRYTEERCVILFIPCKEDDATEYYLNMAIMSKELGSDDHCIPIMINDKDGCYGISADNTLINIPKLNGV